MNRQRWRRSWWWSIAVFGCISGGCQSAPDPAAFDLTLQSALLQSEHGDHSGSFRTLLHSLTEKQADLGRYFGDALPEDRTWLCTMGLMAQSGHEQPFALAMLKPNGTEVPGTSDVVVLLLTRDATVADWIHCSANSREVDLSFIPPTNMRAVEDLTISVSPAGRGVFTGFTLDHHGTRTHRNKALWNPDDDRFVEPLLTIRQVGARFALQGD